MISAETTSRGISCSRPRWVNRDMNSSQIKLGSFSENSNAASLALSIKNRRDSANAWVRSPQGATRPAAGRDREAEAAVCLVSKWDGRRSKEAYSVLAIALGRRRGGRRLCRLRLRRGCLSSESACLLSQKECEAQLVETKSPKCRRASGHTSTGTLAASVWPMSPWSQ